MRIGAIAAVLLTALSATAQEPAKLERGGFAGNGAFTQPQWFR